MTEQTAKYLPDLAFDYHLITATPVATETNGANTVTVCEIPSGALLVTWTAGGIAHGALVGSLALLDSVALPSDSSPTLTPDTGVTRTACFTVGANVYLTVVGDGFFKLYRATNPANPAAGFTLQAVLATVSPAGFDFGHNGASGIPIVIGSRWILPGPNPIVSSLGGSSFNYHQMGVWLSTDGGFTWGLVLSFQTGPFGSGTNGMCGQIMVVGTRMGVWFYGNGVANWYFSDDDGSSWGGNADDIGAPIGNNGVENGAATGGLVYAVDSVGSLTGPVKQSLPFSTDPRVFKTSWLALAGVPVYSFGSQIAYPPLGGWNIGRVAIG